MRGFVLPSFLKVLCLFGHSRGSCKKHIGQGQIPTWGEGTGGRTELVGVDTVRFKAEVQFNPQASAAASVVRSANYRVNVEKPLSRSPVVLSQGLLQTDFVVGWRK